MPAENAVADKPTAAVAPSGAGARAAGETATPTEGAGVAADGADVGNGETGLPKDRSLAEPNRVCLRGAAFVGLEHERERPILPGHRKVFERELEEESPRNAFSNKASPFRREAELDVDRLRRRFDEEVDRRVGLEPLSFLFVFFSSVFFLLSFAFALFLPFSLSFPFSLISFSFVFLLSALEEVEEDVVLPQTRLRLRLFVRRPIRGTLHGIGIVEL
mmetsp:Transcript_19386/g.53225  ORF Transcript_19386/g.53225 Transcript_19386/m.53225 type:complete len:218 (+) Transcript_19386:355-1008(+)